MKSDQQPTLASGNSDFEDTTRIRMFDDDELCNFRWLLSQAVVKCRPWVVISDELAASDALSIRDAAQSVVEPAGYLVVPISNRAALLENVVNQILASIATANNKVHENPVTRKTAEKNLRDIINTPDQRIAIVIQKGDQVPNETYRALGRALKSTTQQSTLPPVVVAIGAEKGFFETNKGDTVVKYFGMEGITADKEAGLVQLIADDTMDDDIEVNWQLIVERLNRDNPSIAARSVVEDRVGTTRRAAKLEVSEPISEPITKRNSLLKREATRRASAKSAATDHAQRSCANKRYPTLPPRGRSPEPVVTPTRARWKLPDWLADYKSGM